MFCLFKVIGCASVPFEIIVTLAGVPWISCCAMKRLLACLAILVIAALTCFSLLTMLNPSHPTLSVGLKTAGNPIFSLTICMMFSVLSLTLKDIVSGVESLILFACCCRSVLSETSAMALAVLFNDNVPLCSIFFTRVCSVPLVSGAMTYVASEFSAAFLNAFSVSRNE